MSLRQLRLVAQAIFMPVSFISHPLWSRPPTSVAGMNNPILRRASRKGSEKVVGKKIWYARMQIQIRP